MIDRAVAGRRQPKTTLIGPGDDAALVSAPDGRTAVSTDMLVEGRHFRLDWSSPGDVGRKAIAQNAADVAALGARPTAFVVALGCPPHTPVQVIDELSAGIGCAAEDLGAGVVGGDLVQTDQIVVSVTVLGDLEGRTPVRRGGARVGDVVAIAGTLGRSGAGLALLHSLGPSAATAQYANLVQAHRTPAPPYTFAIAAAEVGVHAMTDISDGLVADLGHIAQASSVEIVLSDIVAADELALAARALGIDPLTWVLGGGEDHAFAATFDAQSPLPPGWTPIGRVRTGQGVRVTGTDIAGGGWQSF